MPVESLAWGHGLIEGPRVDDAGNLYFSDVTNGGVFRRRPDGSIDIVVPRRSGPRTPGECYRIEAEGRATELYGDVSLSNGIGCSPDGRTIYHSDTAAHAIWVHRLDDGRTTPAAAIRVDGRPDGLAVDAEGGVWVALYGGGAVQRYRPSGTADVRIEVPARAVKSLCFGSADLRDMYVVTADNTDDPARAGTIFRLRCEIAGLPAPLARN